MHPDILCSLFGKDRVYFGFVHSTHIAIFHFENDEVVYNYREFNSNCFREFHPFFKNSWHWIAAGNIEFLEIIQNYVGKSNSWVFSLSPAN